MCRGRRGLLIDACFVTICVWFICVFQFTIQTACCLRRASAGFTNAVDLYNSATGVWSTARLSVARYNLAAVSVGNLVMFVGGVKGGVLLCSCVSGVLTDLCGVDHLPCDYFLPLICVTAGESASNVVDVYNSATGVWSTAQLSVARSALAAVSVGNLAIFTGGVYNRSALLYRG